MRIPGKLAEVNKNLADIKERDEVSDYDASQSASPVKTPVDPRDDLLADDDSDDNVNDPKDAQDDPNDVIRDAANSAIVENNEII